MRRPPYKADWVLEFYSDDPFFETMKTHPGRFGAFIEGWTKYRCEGHYPFQASLRTHCNTFRRKLCGDAWVDVRVWRVRHTRTNAVVMLT